MRNGCLVYGVPMSEKEKEGVSTAGRPTEEAEDGNEAEIYSAWALVSSPKHRIRAGSFPASVPRETERSGTPD